VPGEFAKLAIVRDTDELRAPSVSPGMTAAIIDTYVDRRMTAARSSGTAAWWARRRRPPTAAGWRRPPTTRGGSVPSEPTPNRRNTPLHHSLCPPGNAHVVVQEFAAVIIRPSRDPRHGR